MMVEILYLKYENRLTLEQIKDYLELIYDVKISEAGIFKILRNCSRRLENHYGFLISELIKEDYLHIDESPFRIDGSQNHLWIFRNGKCTVFYIAEERVSVVLERVLGEAREGLVIMDGLLTEFIVKNMVFICKDAGST